MSSDHPRTETPQPDAWTTRRLLDWMRAMFADRDVDSPRVVAEMLLAHVLQCDRMRLYMEVDRPAGPEELTQLRELIARAANHEPVQYLLGEWSFFGRTFAVNPSTLIPRPSTETLVEHALQWIRANHTAASMPVERPAAVRDDTQIQTRPLQIADIGTGTGCIAICLAAQLPMARVMGSDIAPQALELARTNAARHGVLAAIDLRIGNGLSVITHDERFDVICSNPPYISDCQWDQVPANVRNYEPQSALRAGTDGLDVVRPIIVDAWQFINPGGLLLVEIAESQRDAVIELANSAGRYKNIEILKDHEGLWRVLRAQLV